MYNIVEIFDEDDRVGLGCVTHCSTADVVGMHYEPGLVRLTINDDGHFSVDGYHLSFTVRYKTRLNVVGDSVSAVLLSVMVVGGPPPTALQFSSSDQEILTMDPNIVDSDHVGRKQELWYHPCNGRGSSFQLSTSCSWEFPCLPFHDHTDGSFRSFGAETGFGASAPSPSPSLYRRRSTSSFTLTFLHLRDSTVHGFLQYHVGTIGHGIPSMLCTLMFLHSSVNGRAIATYSQHLCSFSIRTIKKLKTFLSFCFHFYLFTALQSARRGCWTCFFLSLSFILIFHLHVLRVRATAFGCFWSFCFMLTCKSW